MKSTKRVDEVHPMVEFPFDIRYENDKQKKGQISQWISGLYKPAILLLRRRDRDIRLSKEGLLRSTFEAGDGEEFVECRLSKFRKGFGSRLKFPTSVSRPRHIELENIESKETLLYF